LVAGYHPPAAGIIECVLRASHFVARRFTDAARLVQAGVRSQKNTPERPSDWGVEDFIRLPLW